MAKIWDMPEDYDPYRPEHSPFVDPGYEPGFYRLGFDDYRALRVVNNGFLKDFSRTPQHGLAYLDVQAKPMTREKRANLDFGIAYHWLVFEPAKWRDKVFEQPSINKNKKEYKTWESSLPKGAISLPAQKIHDAMMMRDKLLRKRSIREVLEAPGHCELTGIFRNKIYPDIWHKIRVDKLCLDGILWDLKSCASASQWAFHRQAYQLKYNWQGALYLNGATQITGVNHQKFGWILQEKEPPYEARLQLADPFDLVEAKEQLKEQVRDLSQCIEENYYPGYADLGVEDLAEPAMNVLNPEMMDDEIAF